MGGGTVAKSIRGNQSEESLSEILHYVKNMRGIVFSAYRSNTIGRRLTGRLQATGMPLTARELTAAVRKRLEGKVETIAMKGELNREDFMNLVKKIDRKSTRLNSSHSAKSRMPSSA